MSSAKEKLVQLNRRFRELVVESFDKEMKATFYYRRPTESEDGVLRTIMQEQFEATRKLLREPEASGKSPHDVAVEVFKGGRLDDAIDSILAENAYALRKQALQDADLKELPDDAPEDEQNDWNEKFAASFERVLEDHRAEWRDEPLEVISLRAADARIDRIARDRAMEIYRRALIQQSLFDKDVDTGTYSLVFDSPEDVSDTLDKGTIDVLASMIVEEINRFKNVPLK